MSAPASTARAPINLPAAILFSVTTLAGLIIVPIYAWHHDFSGWAWFWFALFALLNNLAITAGYHRLWAHRAYQAHWAMRVYYMLMGSMALQNSILVWASMHRVHHKHVDDEHHDPYSARRGLWYSHMGWMLRDEPQHALDLSNARDLMADPIVMFQHKHYLGLALGMNILLPAALGALVGDPWGCLLLAGLVRLLFCHHTTFFINSLAHYWGRQPYTTANTARDNDLLAVLTCGEGYHNYHHLFQWDYRNGIRWWHFDPTKWWIAGWSWLGVTRGLRRVPEFTIQRALLQRQFEKARERLARCTHHNRLQELQQRLELEWDSFSATLGEWTRLQQEKFEAAKQQLSDQWETSEVRRRVQMLEDNLRQQYERVRLLQIQAAR